MNRMILLSSLPRVVLTSVGLSGLLLVPLHLSMQFLPLQSNKTFPRMFFECPILLGKSLLRTTPHKKNFDLHGAVRLPAPFSSPASPSPASSSIPHVPPFPAYASSSLLVYSPLASHWILFSSSSRVCFNAVFLLLSWLWPGPGPQD